MLRNASMWEAMAKRTGNAILLAYFLVIWSVLTFVGSTIISLEDFNRSDPVILNHLVIDHDSNDLYIGAKNRLYRLSSDLTLRNLEYTGPKNDSQRCNLNAINDPSKCSAPKQLTDNYNKILLVDKYYGQRRILTCGNLFQGKCESRDYITLKEQETFPIAVATNDPDANSVAFFATVRPALASSPEITIYTASDFFQHKKAKEDLAYLIRKDQVKAIGVRKVNPVSETFKLINDLSFLKYQSSYLEGANILTFVTGFVSGKYRYLVMVEKGEFSNKTFIVHMCEEDDKFNCFVEIPLQCRSNSSSFTTATSARVIAPSQKLKNIIGLDDGDEVVVVTFKNGEKLASSAVCVYSMKFIQKVVVQNVKGCHSKNEDFAQNKFDEGNLCDNLIPTDDIISNQTNSNVQVTSDEELLCPQILRERISGVIPAENQAVAVFHDTELTSIALTTTTDFTVAFLGTAQGAIRKLVLESNKTGTVYGGTTVVDSGSAIRQDMMFDRDAEFIYAMSETKVAKIKAHNCQQYTTCSACLTSKDPHYIYIVYGKR